MSREKDFETYLDSVEMKNWVESVRRQLFPKLRESAVYLSLNDGGDPPPQYCLELGAAIMLQKPILVIAFKGCVLPPN